MMAGLMQTAPCMHSRQEASSVLQLMCKPAIVEKKHHGNLKNTAAPPCCLQIHQLERDSTLHLDFFGNAMPIFGIKVDYRFYTCRNFRDCRDGRTSNERCLGKSGTSIRPEYLNPRGKGLGSRPIGFHVSTVATDSIHDRRVALMNPERSNLSSILIKTQTKRPFAQRSADMGRPAFCVDDVDCNTSWSTAINIQGGMLLVSRKRNTARPTDKTSNRHTAPVQQILSQTDRACTRDGFPGHAKLCTGLGKRCRRSDGQHQNGSNLFHRYRLIVRVGTLSPAQHDLSMQVLAKWARSMVRIRGHGIKPLLEKNPYLSMF